jgi:DNA-binding NtrC family response regulator
VDVRLIAATNRLPDEAVRSGALREDLYYRLNVFPIALPPLRERGEDVQQIAESFLDALNREAGTSKSFSEAARATLVRHDWPGNVRELKNALQRAFILSGEEIELEIPKVGSLKPSGAAVPGIEGVRLGQPLDEVERHVILATLEKCGGDKRKAAEMLGISLKTLYNRLSSYQSGAAGVATL